MGRRDEFEDDGRTVADMSDLAGVGLFGRHSYMAKGTLLHGRVHQRAIEETTPVEAGTAEQERIPGKIRLLPGGNGCVIS